MQHEGTGSPRTEALIREGLAASQAAQVDQAIAKFKEAIESDPSAGLPHFLMGAELAQLGRMAEAEAAFASAVLLAPGLEIARFQLGLLQFTSGRPTVGLLTWTPLLGAPVENPLQRIVHGFAALAADDFSAALTCFREGIALNQTNAPLNRDVQMVIDLILSQVPELGSPAEDQRSGAAEEQSPDGNHVLLSNYKQSGPYH